MHGITRTRNAKKDVEAIETSYTHVRRVLVRYADGRNLAFVPEARREEFSEDDMLALAKVLAHASATAEWSAVGETTRAGG